MADYSTRLTKRLRSDGDVLVEAGSDMTVTGPNVSVTGTTSTTISAPDVTVSGTSTLKFSDSSVSDIALSQLYGETLVEERTFDGGNTSAFLVNGEKVDQLEQTFVGTTSDDWVDLDGVLSVTDNAGGTDLNWRITIQRNVDGAGFVDIKQVQVVLPGTATPYVGPGAFLAPFNIGTSSVAFRFLVELGGGELAFLTGDSFVRMRHVRKRAGVTASTTSWTLSVP